MNTTYDENLDISMKEISNVIKYLESIKFSELNILIVNLLKESLREITIFHRQRSEITQVSTQVRNILELYLITKHIYTDNKGLKSWLGQMHKDLEDVNFGAMALMNKNNIVTSELEELMKFTNKSLGESPYQSKGGFNLKTLAINYGYEEDYNFVHKLSSKLIHPTSMKVNGYAVMSEDSTCNAGQK